MNTEIRETRNESRKKSFHDTNVWRLSLLVSLLSFLVFPACTKHADNSSANTAHAGKTLYHCAMHPQIVSDHPGECPICHMKLTPVELGTRSSEQTSLPVPGQAAIHMSSDMEQRIGVRVAEVQRRELIIPIQAAARVAYDPQLYSASLEHQEAVKLLNQARKSESSDSLEQAAATVSSSKLRLRQMGLSDAQIEDIESTHYNPSDLLVGTSGESLWVYADIYDAQVSLVHPGLTVELTSPAFPGKTYKGTVRAIDTIMNSDSRTLRVRIKAANLEGELRPGVYLSALIHATLGNVIVVPESAVVDTGTRQLVYVQTVPGTYEPRLVKVGHLADGYDEIVDGLHPGEKVASSANFLIDSESRIEAAAKEAAEHL
jgi:Cu(I)/Ag(I) efflux system membrane fusion protein